MKSDSNKIIFLAYSQMLKLSVVSNTVTCEASSLPGCNALSLGERFPEFLRIIMPTFSKFQVDCLILAVSYTRRLEPSTTQLWELENSLCKHVSLKMVYFRLKYIGNILVHNSEKDKRFFLCTHMVSCWI